MAVWYASTAMFLFLRPSASSYVRSVRLVDFTPGLELVYTRMSAHRAPLLWTFEPTMVLGRSIIRC